MSKYFKYILSLIAAFFSIFPFGLSYFWEDVSSNGAKVCWYKLLDNSCLWNREQTEPFNNIFFLVLFLALAYIYTKIYDLLIKNKRLTIFSCTLATAFAVFEVFGHSFAAVSGLDEIFLDYHNFIKSIIRIIGYDFIFTALIAFLFENIIPKISKFDIKPQKFPSQSKNHFLFCIGGGYIMYSIFIFKYWPMVYTWDTLEYINQIFGYLVLSDHHPIFNALVIAPFIKFGLLIGNVNYGVFLAVLIQIALISLTTAYAIQTIAKLNLPYIVRLSITAFYAFYPLFPFQAATLCKDTPFGYAMLVFVLCLLQLGIQKENFFKSKLNISLLILSAILTILHRKNGFHVILLSLPFIIWFCKDFYRKKTIIFSISIVLFYVFWNWFSLKIGVKFNTDGEKYSLISQQFARIAKTENLSNEDKTEMQKYIRCDLEKFAKNYHPEIADHTKGSLNTSKIKEDFSGFISFSLKMIKKYPLQSINAFLCTTYGYWYIEYTDMPDGGGPLNYYIPHNQLVKQFEQKQFFYNPLADIAQRIMQSRKIPIISLFFRCGFIIWIFLFCFTYCWYRKKYNLMLIYSPIFALWFTCLASPYSTYRYIFGIMTSLPILFVTIFINNNNFTKNQQTF